MAQHTVQTASQARREQAKKGFLVVDPSYPPAATRDETIYICTRIQHHLCHDVFVHRARAR